MAAPPPAIAPKTPKALARSGIVEGDRDQGECGRSHQGGERTLGGPRPEQQPGARRQSAQQRGGSEAHQTDDEHSLAAGEVRDAPTEQQQASEREGVGGHDPLHISGRDAPGRPAPRGSPDSRSRRRDDHQLGQGDDESALNRMGPGWSPNTAWWCRRQGSRSRGLLLTEVSAPGGGRLFPCRCHALGHRRRIASELRAERGTSTSHTAATDGLPVS